MLDLASWFVQALKHPTAFFSLQHKWSVTPHLAAVQYILSRAPIHEGSQDAGLLLKYKRKGLFS